MTDSIWSIPRYLVQAKMGRTRENRIRALHERGVRKGPAPDFRKPGAAPPTLDELVELDILLRREILALAGGTEDAARSMNKEHDS